VAPKSTSFFTECVSNTSPLQKPLGVLEPVEKVISNFFEELKQGYAVSEEKLNNIKQILTDFISDELLPQDDREKLIHRAKQLQKQLIAIDYFTQYPSTDALSVYLRLLAINQKPITSLNSPKSEKNSTHKNGAEKDKLETGCREFLKIAYEKIQRIHHELRPLEAQPPLSMLMPHFEEVDDVHSYIYPFQQRAKRAVWLNDIKAELRELQVGFSSYAGVADSGQLRLIDQYKKGVSSLLKRIATLRAGFSRHPQPLKTAISGASQPLPHQGNISKKTAHLTFS
jgi:hypothetical protein